MLRRLLLLLVAFARCEVVDYYAVLGVARTATTAEIKKAYRALAQEYHPDKLASTLSEEAKAEAVAKFVALAQAHEVLSDDDRRRAYDATGADEPDAEAEARAAEQGPPEYTELPVKVEARFRHGAFRFSFAGTGVRAMSATRVPITVTMEDLLVGVTRNLTLSRRVKCRACDGTGSARPARRPTCPLCGGTGRAPALGTAGRPPSPFRQSFESLCGACGGFGKLRGPPCESCDGEGIAAETHVVTVVVPPGAPEGHEIVFRGLGDEHAHRDAGDLVVVVETAPHGRFARSVDGANVWCNASVGLLDALYGFSKKLTGLDGARLDVRHNRVAFSSFTHELPGEGLPVFGNATQRGSLTVYVAVSFPRSLSALQLRVLRHIGLRPDELDFIRALQLLMAYQYATTVPDGSDELKFASRCYGDALDVCKPERRYWTWWRAVV